MLTYLKIENPGVAPIEAFTVLGASTKRGHANDAVIGKFGTGNKHGVAVLLRNNMKPVVYAGSLCMEFGTRTQNMNDGLGDHSFNRVFVKYSGKDIEGVSRSGTEDLGFVLEHGSEDWLDPKLAIREFISNALDRAIQEGEHSFCKKWIIDQGITGLDDSNRELVTVDLGAALKKYRENSTDFQNVVVELVNESQVRAKSGFTRIFIPLTSEVLDFYHNLGKWFLHFSEPEMLKRTILPKSNRNIGDHRQTAVIYRRGVRVREITRIDTPSLYDYNLENLKMDESRQVDDHVVQHEAAVALSKSDVETLSRLFQSFMNNEKFWEHSFSEYSLSEYCNDSHYKKNWLEAFDKVADKNSVFSTEEGGKVAARKGYNVICAPYTFVRAAERYDLKTPSKVLSLDDHLGREIVETHYNSLVALNFAWDLCERHKLTNGKNKPIVKNFRKIMDGGTQDLGFYRNDEVYLNEDIVGSSHIEHWSELNQQLLVTCLEEVSHHVTGSTDFSRDFQDFLLNLLVYVAKEK